MNSPHPFLAVKIPFLNPNEIEGLLVTLSVQNGEKVAAGEVLAVFETTKSTAEIVAEQVGFISGLHLAEGQIVRAGEIFCFLADDPNPVLPVLEAPQIQSTISGSDLNESPLPEGLRITRPAMALVYQHHLDLSSFPIGLLITEAQVREMVSRLEPSLQEIYPKVTEKSGGKSRDDTSLVIYGGGGHGKSLIELVRSLGSYRLVGVVDDGLLPGMDVLGVPVLGGEAVLAGLYLRGIHLAINAIGGIGNLAPRLKVFESLEHAGFSCPKVIHPTAFIEASAHMEDGIQVFPHAYIGSSVGVGFGVIVNTGAIVSHDCRLGDYVNLSPGAMLAGGVKIGPKTLIGMGVTINLEVKIGSEVRIGNSATIKADVPDGKIVKAGSIWPI